MNLLIKEHCKKKGITLIELANSLNITRQSLDKRIKNNPTIESIREIAEVLEVDPIQLFEPSADYAHFYSEEEWLGIRRK